MERLLLAAGQKRTPHHHLTPTPFQTGSPKGSDLGQSHLDPAVPETRTKRRALTCSAGSPRGRGGVRGLTQATDSQSWPCS